MNSKQESAAHQAENGRPLVAATPQDQLVQSNRPKVVRGLTAEQIVPHSE